MKNKNIILIIIVLFILFFLIYFFINNKLKNSNDVISENNITDKINNIEEEKLEINNIEEKNMNITFNTNKGDFTIELYKDLAPKTVENFTKLAKEGFYDNTKFHRVIEGFMNQGGDPLSKDDNLKDKWGTGDPGYKFEDEIHSQNKNDIGTISMANLGPNTNGSQFFINVAQNNFLDDKHTVFGKVIEGMDIVLLINKVETDAMDKPTEAVIINKLILIE